MNTSNKPYEFTWDGGHYGPIMPGQIVDYPDDMANHCMKRSTVLFQDGDMMGDIDYYQMVPLDSVDPKKVRDNALYECPLVASGQCNAKSFASMAELKAHLDGHWELLPEAPKPQAKTAQGALPSK